MPFFRFAEDLGMIQKSLKNKKMHAHMTDCSQKLIIEMCWETLCEI